MQVANEKKQDKATRLIYQALRKRFPNLPNDMSQVVYRYNPAAIRVRVIDGSFAGKTFGQREHSIADVLESLPEDVQRSITVLLLMTTKEAKDPSDLMNQEFDDPSGSRL